MIWQTASAFVMTTHQADSDAEVTAALFLYIEAIMRQLPRTTLKQIALLSGQMGMQTSEYIHGILKEKGPELAEDFEVIDGVVLRKKLFRFLKPRIFKKRIRK